MSSPKVAIIGAGPAGCMLARLLHLSNIETVVFEGEASPNYRSQGGTLDLHTETGLAAVKEAGLWDEFLKHARYDGEYMLVSDPQLRPHLTKGTKPTSEQTFGGQRPEIDRSDLRQLLADSLPKGMIRWGHHLKSVDDQGTLVFEHTTERGFDLVVGAEGAWSKVRQTVLGDRAGKLRPQFSGIALIQFEILDPEHTAPELYKLVNRGSVFALGESRRVNAQQMGDGSLSVGVCFREESADWDKKCGYDPTNLEEVKKAMLGPGGLFADFHPTLHQTISRASGKATPRSLYMLPVGLEWTHRSGLTLIGDAAHLMTPFAGEGVNVALDDARRLAAAIAAAAKEEGPESMLQKLDAKVGVFEREMFARAGRVTRLTDDLTKTYFFTPGGAQSIVPRMTTLHACFNTPKILHWPITLAVHGYFFVKRILGLDGGLVLS